MTAFGKGVGIPWQGGGRPNTPAVTSGGRAALLPVDSGPPPGVNPPGPGGRRQFAKDPDFANVVLLLPSDGADAFTSTVDWSVTPHISTAVGTAQLDTAQSKFGTAAMLFDGDSDEFTFVDHADWDIGGDFTIECWVRFNGSALGDQTIMGHYRANGSQRSWRLFLHQTNEDIGFVVSSNGTDGAGFIFDEVAPWAPVVNRWYHLAVSRKKNKISVYIDGDRKIRKSISGTPHNSTDVLRIGANGTDADKEYFDGWIDDVRIVSGEALYTKQSYKVPIKAHDTSAAGVSDSDYLSVGLLVPFDGADAATSTPDYSIAAHAITFAGGAALDTARKQFGTASLLLDGSTADFCSLVDSADWDIGSGEFTIECWVNLDVLPVTTSGYWLGQTEGANQIGWGFGRVASTGAINFLFSTDGQVGTQVSNNTGSDDGMAADTWHHVAAVRDSDTLRVFLDGTEIATYSMASVTVFNSNQKLAIGVLQEANGALPVGEGSDAWIDDVRITKGVARYTANFTVPSITFPTHN